jgi:hypothetical protein
VPAIISDASIQDTPIRLTISHLLLWTGVAAVLLVQSQQTHPGGNYPAGMGPLHFINMAIVITVRAAALTGISILLLHRTPWRRIRHPGHWMLLIHGMLFLIPFALVNLLPDGVSIELPLTLTAFLFGIAVFANRSLWRAYFLTVGTIATTQFVIESLPVDWLIASYKFWMPIRDIGLPIVTFLMLAYSVYDARKRKRDSLHWVGIACDVLSVANMTWYIAYLRMNN